jgi:NADP-dependent aldehyde dehydrogenase
MRAVAAATAAFNAALASSPDERARWLESIAAALDGHTTELVELAVAETHLTEARLTGEVARTTGQLRLFATVVREGSYLEATIDHADATSLRPDIRRMLRPLGPVAVYAASNFPFAFSVAGGDTASALAAGAPVVVKAHPGHPLTSRRTAELVTEALRAAGAPNGLFALVEGFEEGIALVEHPGIRAAAFTGSLRGGRALFDRAAARPAPIPFFGELGSINPVVITPAADAARAAELADGLLSSFQLGSGQFCTKPGVVFVPAGSTVEAALTGRELAGRPDLLTEGMDAAFATAVADRAGIHRVAENPSGGSVIFAVDAAELTEQLLTEVFGPTTLLVRYADEAQLHEALALLEGSLTATVHAEPGDDLQPLVATLEELAGRVLFSGWPTGVAVTWSQHHGGPWPATTSQHTSVGATAIRRFLRPIAYQDAPEGALPEALREGNPLGIPRRVDGVLTT